jgi:hypothetical protein
MLIFSALYLSALGQILQCSIIRDDRLRSPIHIYQLCATMEAILRIAALLLEDKQTPTTTANTTDTNPATVTSDSRLETADSSANSKALKPYTGPNYLFRFPPELRTKICESLWPDKIVVRRGEVPKIYFFRQFKETASPGLIYKTRLQRFSRHKGLQRRGPRSSPPTDCSDFLTGLLFTYKQLYHESSPYLYCACTFQLNALGWANSIFRSLSEANLKAIRSIEIEPDICNMRDETRFRSLCRRIIKQMPNIEVLRIRTKGNLESQWKVGALVHIRTMTFASQRELSGT